MSELLDIEPRKGLTKPVLLHWALNYMRCAECGCALTNGFHDDHIKPLSMGGTNAPHNRQPLCKPCHKEKTRLEASIRAKADRQSGRKGQVARRERRKDKGVEIWQQGKKIPKRVNAWGKAQGGNVRVDD